MTPQHRLTTIRLHLMNDNEQLHYENLPFTKQPTFFFSTCLWTGGLALASLFLLLLLLLRLRLSMGKGGGDCGYDGGFVDRLGTLLDRGSA